MRFARFNFNEHTQLMVDVQEYEFPLMHILNTEEPERGECVQSLSVNTPEDYQSLPLYCVYGVFLPNDSLTDDELVEYVAGLSSHKLMTFAGTDATKPQCQSAGMLELIAPVITELDSLRKIPIAALIYAEDERALVGNRLDGAIENNSIDNSLPYEIDKSASAFNNEGRSFFLCFDNLDPFTNFLSRPGIFFFKTADLVTDSNARSLADRVDIQILHKMAEMPLL